MNNFLPQLPCFITLFALVVNGCTMDMQYEDQINIQSTDQLSISAPNIEYDLQTYKIYKNASHGDKESVLKLIQLYQNSDASEATLASSYLIRIILVRGGDYYVESLLVTDDESLRKAGINAISEWDDLPNDFVNAIKSLVGQ